MLAEFKPLSMGFLVTETKRSRLLGVQLRHAVPLVYSLVPRPSPMSRAWERGYTCAVPRVHKNGQL